MAHIHNLLFSDCLIFILFDKKIKLKERETKLTHLSHEVNLAVLQHCKADCYFVQVNVCRNVLFLSFLFTFVQIES